MLCYTSLWKQVLKTFHFWSKKEFLHPYQEEHLSQLSHKMAHSNFYTDHCAKPCLYMITPNSDHPFQSNLQTQSLLFEARPLLCQHQSSLMCQTQNSALPPNNAAHVRRPWCRGHLLFPCSQWLGQCRNKPPYCLGRGIQKGIYPHYSTPTAHGRYLTKDGRILNLQLVD